jgi:predicted dehydrogenase
MDVGVIGVGTMGKNHVRVYSELKHADRVGVYDLNAAAAREVAEKHGAETYSSVQELLHNADAVSVCVPTPFHGQVVQEIFRAKKPVLIEKPLCATAGEAERLMRHAPEGITVGVGHIERFNPIVGELRRIVKKHLYVEMKRHNPASARVTGSTVIEDLMIHDIDILLSLFCSEPADLHSAGTADVCSVLMKCGSIPVALSASRKSSKKIRMVYVEEEEFTIEGDFMTQEVTIYRKPGQYLAEDERYVQENIIEKVMVNKLEPLKRELATFLDCVNENRPFPVTPEQAIRNLRVCEAIAAGLKK